MIIAIIIIIMVIFNPRGPLTLKIRVEKIMKNN